MALSQAGAGFRPKRGLGGERIRSKSHREEILGMQKVLRIALS